VQGTAFDRSQSLGFSAVARVIETSRRCFTLPQSLRGSNGRIGMPSSQLDLSILAGQRALSLERTTGFEPAIPTLAR
jgi:hypothetical protein